MSLFEFFREFTQTYEMQRLADISANMKIQANLAQARHQQERVSANQRIVELEAEVAQLTIVLEAIIEKFYESGVLNGDDLAKKIAEIDLRDGVADGKITKTKPSLTVKKQVRKEVKLRTSKSDKPPVKLVYPAPKSKEARKDSIAVSRVFTKEPKPKQKY